MCIRDRPQIHGLSSVHLCDRGEIHPHIPETVLLCFRGLASCNLTPAEQVLVKQPLAAVILPDEVFLSKRPQHTLNNWRGQLEHF